jgi:fucose permease
VIWLQATKYILENSIQNKDRLITIFLTFYPLGHLTAPQIASFLINHDLSWRYSYFFMIVLVVIIIILYLVLKKEERTGMSIEEENKLQFKKIFFNRNLNIIFVFGCILILFYTISETVISAWVPTFLRSVRFFDIQTAGLMISIFWLAVIAGRIIVSFFAGRLKTNYMILILTIIALASMIVFVSRDSFKFAITAIIFAGLGYSGIPPLGISSASTIYEKGRGVLASIVFSAANIGISVAPFITRFFSRFNMNLSVAMAPIFMLFTSLIVIGKIIYENISGKKKI